VKARNPRVTPAASSGRARCSRRSIMKVASWPGAALTNRSASDSGANGTSGSARLAAHSSASAREPEIKPCAHERRGDTAADRNAARPDLTTRTVLGCVVATILFDGAVPQPPRPYLARNRFRWTKFAQSARLLGIVQRGRRRIAELAFLDHGYPVWYQLEMDLATGRALRARRLTPRTASATLTTAWIAACGSSRRRANREPAAARAGLPARGRRRPDPRRAPEGEAASVPPR
jgi:hypothetical protein